MLVSLLGSSQRQKETQSNMIELHLGRVDVSITVVGYLAYAKSRNYLSRGAAVIKTTGTRRQPISRFHFRLVFLSTHTRRRDITCLVEISTEMTDCLYAGVQYHCTPASPQYTYLGLTDYSQNYVYSNTQYPSLRRHYIGNPGDR